MLMKQLHAKMFSAFIAATALSTAVYAAPPAPEQAGPDHGAMQVMHQERQGGDFKDRIAHRPLPLPAQRHLPLPAQRPLQLKWRLKRLLTWIPVRWRRVARD